MTARPLHYAAQQPMAHQSLALQDEWEKQRKAKQAEMLRRAEGGDQEALDWVRGRLLYWWRLGEEIIG